MKLSFIHVGTTPTMFSTSCYRNPKKQATNFVREPTNITLTDKQNFISKMLFVDMCWLVIY